MMPHGCHVPAVLVAQEVQLGLTLPLQPRTVRYHAAHLNAAKLQAQHVTLVQILVPLTSHMLPRLSKPASARTLYLWHPTPSVHTLLAAYRRLWATHYHLKGYSVSVGAHYPS